MFKVCSETAKLAILVRGCLSWLPLSDLSSSFFPWGHRHCHQHHKQPHSRRDFFTGLNFSQVVCVTPPKKKEEASIFWVGWSRGGKGFSSFWQDVARMTQWMLLLLLSFEVCVRDRRREIQSKGMGFLWRRSQHRRSNFLFLQYQRERGKIARMLSKW